MSTPSALDVVRLLHETCLSLKPQLPERLSELTREEIGSFLVELALWVRTTFGGVFRCCFINGCLLSGRWFCLEGLSVVSTLRCESRKFRIVSSVI